MKKLKRLVFRQIHPVVKIMISMRKGRTRMMMRSNTT
jgi:hypothetical protein